MCILAFKTRHNLTFACISDILNLIAEICVKPNSCIKSVYKQKKIFENTQIQTAVVEHYYCLKCSLLIEEKSALCPQCEESNNDYFLEIPLFSQVESLYQRPDFYLKLKRRLDDNSFKLPGIYADIYDGDL